MTRLLCALLLAVGAALGVQTSDAYPTDTDLLARVRAHVGGDRLDAVRSMEVRRGTAIYRFMLPNRFQSILSSSFGPAIVTLDGADFWEVSPGPPGAALPSSDVPKETLVRRQRERLGEMAMSYLLRPLPGNTQRVARLGTRQYGPLSGLALEIIDSEFGTFQLLCDAVDYQPLALVYRRRVPPSTELADLVIQLEDYREVGGIRVPFAVRYSIANQGLNRDRDLVRYVSSQVLVNPAFSADEFVRKR